MRRFKENGIRHLHAAFDRLPFFHGNGGGAIGIDRCDLFIGGPSRGGVYLCLSRARHHRISSSMAAGGKAISMGVRTSCVQKRQRQRRRRRQKQLSRRRARHIDYITRRSACASAERPRAIYEGAKSRRLSSCHVQKRASSSDEIASRVRDSGALSCPRRRRHGDALRRLAKCRITKPNQRNQRLQLACPVAAGTAGSASTPVAYY